MSKVRGEKQLPEPSEPKKKREVDSDEFKKMMGKIKETEPEEKRKRKRPEEAEEEAKAKITQKKPRQGLGAEGAKEPSPYEPKLGGKETPPSTGEPAAQPPSETPPSFYPPPTEEPWEEEEVQPTEATRAPEKKRAKKKKKPEKKEPIPFKEKGKKKEKVGPAISPKIKKEEPIPFEKKEAIVEKLPPIKEEKKPEEKKEKKEVLEEVPPPPLPKGAWEAIKEPEKKEEEVTAPTPTETHVPPPTAPPIPPPSPATTPFANLPPQVMQLFERMVGVMTVMTESGITETTINLNNPQFAQSVFYGAQIVITEFSTAPKAFNLELLGNANAAQLFAENAEDLVAAFQAGQYNFKVNRVDTGILPAVSEAKRKKARRVQRKKGA